MQRQEAAGAGEETQSPASKSEKKKKKKKQPAETAVTGASVPGEDTPHQPKKRREERPETAVANAETPPTNAHQEQYEYPESAQERRDLKSQAAEADEDGGCIQKKEHQQQTRLEDLKHVIRTSRQWLYQSVSRPMPEQKQSLIGDYCHAQEGKAKGKGGKAGKGGKCGKGKKGKVEGGESEGKGGSPSQGAKCRNSFWAASAACHFLHLFLTPHVLKKTSFFWENFPYFVGPYLGVHNFLLFQTTHC